MCKCLFSKVTVQAVTESDNKAAYCHTPVLQRHRPFRGRCLYCQTHHFFHRLVCRKHLRFLIEWRITLFSDPDCAIVCYACPQGRLFFLYAGKESLKKWKQVRKSADQDIISSVHWRDDKRCCVHVYLLRRPQ